MTGGGTMFISCRAFDAIQQERGQVDPYVFEVDGVERSFPVGKLAELAPAEHCIMIKNGVATLAYVGDDE